MTTPDATPGPDVTEPQAHEPEAVDAVGGAAAALVLEDPEERKRRRRKAALLLLLAALLGIFALFSLWYLVNRKPVTELPLPGLVQDAVPHYAYSLYGVSAPTGVAVSPDGDRVYVTQTERDAAVLVFDGSGKQLVDDRSRRRRPGPTTSRSTWRWIRSPATST